MNTKSGQRFLMPRHRTQKAEVQLITNEEQSFLKEQNVLLHMLKECTSLKDLQRGSKIHHHLSQRGFLQKSIYVGSALINMYAKCGALRNARSVLDELPFQNCVTWTALIAGYAQHGLGDDAIECLKEMRKKHITPNAVTFACLLKACATIGAIEQGKQLHTEIVKERMLKDSTMLATALVDMYAKCGALANAKGVFEELLDRNVIVWTALMAGYAQNGKGEEALFCFEQMLQEGYPPNGLTLSCTLKACGCAGAAQKGKHIHAQVEKLLGKDDVLWTALVDMYAKCGALAEARKISDGRASRNIVSWTALLSRYCTQGHVMEALHCFDLMKSEGLSSDIVAFACILKACGRIGATAKGEEAHAAIVQSGLLEKMCVLGGALVDMYAKSGAIDKAKRAFDNLPYRSVVAWTALLAGHSQAGDHEIVFDLFFKMIKDGVKPNMVTFLVILNACQVPNFVQHGQMYLNTMSTHYGVLPSSEHIACMVSLFACAGHFDEAAVLIEKVPSSMAWFALLSACNKFGGNNVQIGSLAFKNLGQLKKRDAFLYTKA